MKKLVLSALTLIVLVGAVFAPSSAWSQSDCLQDEVCFLSSYSREVDITTETRIALAVNQDLSIVVNCKIFNDCDTSGNPLAVTTRKVLGVTYSNIFCSGCHNDNPENVITHNGHSQKRADIHLC